MNLFYFLQKYLDKKNNVEFRITWEKLIQSRMKTFIVIIILIWLLSTALLGYLISLLVWTFIAIVLTFFFGAYIAYVFFVQTLKFLATNNTRYIQSKMEMDENVINYDNVVG